jgi:hypothetical protein
MASLDPTTRNDGCEAECSTSSGGETRTTSSGQEGGVLRIIGACRAFFDSFSAPLGYEDETGFHYGSGPKTD